MKTLCLYFGALFHFILFYCQENFLSGKVVWYFQSFVKSSEMGLRDLGSIVFTGSFYPGVLYRYHVPRCFKKNVKPGISLLQMCFQPIFHIWRRNVFYAIFHAFFNISHIVLCIRSRQSQ